MNISFSVSAAPTIVDKLAFVLYKASAPTVIAYSKEFDPPHPQRNITFTDVEPVVYIVNTYETPGLPELGILRNSWVYNPEFSDLLIKVQYLNMVEDTIQYDVPDGSWDGFKVLYIDRRGAGAQRLRRATDVEPDTQAEVSVRDAETDDPKGFTLLKEGDGFFADELVIVTLITRIVTQTPIYNVAKIVRDERIIDNDAAVTLDDANKGLLLQGAAGVNAFTVALPTIGTFDNFTAFYFISEGGNHINVTLSAGEDKIFYWNANGSGYRNQLHLAQSERILIYNTADGWRVLQEHTGILKVGEHVESGTFEYVNTLYLDGRLLLRNTYRRLWEYLNSAIGATLVTDSNWNAVSSNFKAYFSSGDGTTNFRLPQVYSAGFPRPVNRLVRDAGNYAPDSVVPHAHEQTIGILPNTLFGFGDTNRTIGQYNRTRFDKSDLTSQDIWFKTSGGLYVKQAAGITETAPKSYGIFKSIRA